MTFQDEIISALELWFQPDAVFEVRVLDATTASYHTPHVESGYFEARNMAAVADAIATLRSYRGAYATVNPVNPDLLARSYNRLQPAARNCATGDKDILRRRWLLIDCDPDRPSGISANDSEHEAALAKACEVRAGLASLGWPDPIMTDSGNGAQLMYRVDLPSDDDGLLQRVLAEIATASDAQVHIDCAVHNASRIWRIPGTMNCKGDDIPGRPHRRATLLAVPLDRQCVTIEQLQALAGSKTPAADDMKGLLENGDFNLDEWIARYCPGIGEANAYKDGRKWVFPVCPFNSDHSNRSAALFQNGEGAVGFRCLHNSCSGNDWRKLRVMLEPGCYAHREEHPDVDLSGIVGKPVKPVVHRADPNRVKPAVKKQRQASNSAAPAQDISFPDPGEMPERLTHIPGFIDDYVAWSMSSAPYPNRILSFGGALAFESYLVGRKITSDRNTLPNIYLIVLADSGAGKDHPRKVNMTTAVNCGIGGGVIEDCTSGGGLEDTLYLYPTLLLQKDEIDTLFNAMKYAKDTNSETMLGKLLTIYGASNSLIKLRGKAMNRGDLLKLKDIMTKGEGGSEPSITNPYLVIFGTAIPEFFYASLSPRLLGNGMAARCIPLLAGHRGAPSRSKIITLPDNLKSAVETMRAYGGGGGNLDSLKPQLDIIRVEPRADKLLDELSVRYHRVYCMYEASRAQIPMAFWARAFEKAIKLSLLYGVSANVADPVITVEAVEWADAFVDFVTRQALFQMSSYSYENPFDEKCQKILRYIRAGGGSYGHAELLHRSHESKDMFEQIIETLTDSGIIASELVDTGGKRMKRVYRLCESEAGDISPGQ